jgi:hypothetical protein
MAQVYRQLSMIHKAHISFLPKDSSLLLMRWQRVLPYNGVRFKGWVFHLKHEWIDFADFANRTHPPVRPASQKLCARSGTGWPDARPSLASGLLTSMATSLGSRTQQRSVPK